MSDTGKDACLLSLTDEQGERFLEEVNDETDPEWGGEGARDSALPLTTRDCLPNQDSSRFEQIVSPTRNSVLITDGGVDQDDGEGDHFAEQLNRISDEGYALVDDEGDDKWLSVVYEGTIGHILCTTLHSNGIADGEEIPTPLAREFIEDDGLVFEEPPEKVEREVKRLERI